MPYIFKTGKRFDFTDAGVGGVQIDPDSIVAVATLEEARTLAYEHNLVAVPEDGCHVTQPDGTVIEVEPKLWRDLVDEAYGPDLRNFLHLSEDEILAAFNTRQAGPPTHLTPRPPQGAGWYGN